MIVDSQIRIAGWYLSCCLVQSTELPGSIPAGWSCSPRATHRCFSGHTFLFSVALKGSKALHHFDWNMLPSNVYLLIRALWHLSIMWLIPFQQWSILIDGCPETRQDSWGSIMSSISSFFHMQSILLSNIFCMIFYFSTSQPEKTC